MPATKVWLKPLPPPPSGTMPRTPSVVPRPMMLPPKEARLLSEWVKLVSTETALPGTRHR